MCSAGIFDGDVSGHDVGRVLIIGVITTAAYGMFQF